MLRVFVGFDAREIDAYQVCVRSMLRASSEPLMLEPLLEPHLRAVGMYRRQHERRGAVLWDVMSDAPMGTEFSLTRFLVPTLARGRGWALYCDCDFLWRGDAAELFDLGDPRYAVMVVQHQHQPAETTKMEGQVQTAYPRKNWSSLMLINCEHEAFDGFGPAKLDTLTKHELHGFTWLPTEAIGDLPLEWNWLEGVSDAAVRRPKAVHFTRGVPSMPGYENSAYADEWRAMLAQVHPC